MTDQATPTDVSHALLSAHSRMMSAALAQTIESLDFLKRRFERDRQMLADLSAAPDSAAAAEILSAFCQRSFSDYAAEAGRMAAMMTATAEQIGEGLQDETSALIAGSARPH